MTFEMLKPIEEGSIACLTCGCGAHKSLFMDRVIAVGFGEAAAYKDGKCVYSENDVDEEGWLNVAHIEAMAISDPDHDWRIRFYAPLYEAEYQRQGDEHWVLVKKGEGFA